MLIISQCGTGVFEVKHFVGTWIKRYSDNTYVLKGLFRNKEVILGTFTTKADAQIQFDNLINTISACHNGIYKVGGKTNAPNCEYDS